MEHHICMMEYFDFVPKEAALIADELETGDKVIHTTKSWLQRRFREPKERITENQTSDVKSI